MNSQKVIFRCSGCGHDNLEMLTQDQNDLACKHCSKQWSLRQGDELFEHCPMCSCKAFFVQKSIHPKWMLGGLVLGIVLVPWTYGLSLPALWLIDLAIHKKIPDLLVCYRCRAAFAGFDIPKRFKPFQHHIGDKYDTN